MSTWRHLIGEHRFVTAPILLLAFALPTNAVVGADSPVVTFDVSSIVACRDVTTVEFALENPDERLLEIKLEVSSMLHKGSDEQLAEMVYRIQSSFSDIQVIDYSPKTRLSTNVAGKVGIEKKKESSKSLGINGDASLQQYVVGKLSGVASIGSKSNSVVKYEVLPPLESLSTSGTIGRGSGVYFKLRFSSRTSLEGSQPFVIVVRVPNYWRAGLFYVNCHAKSVQRGVVKSLDESLVCGKGKFVASAYLEGDDEAKATARQFGHDEAVLRQMARQAGKSIKQRRYPSVAHRFGSLFELVDPKIPDDWLERVVFAQDGPALIQFEQYLPSRVRGAAERFLESKWKLTQLSGAGARVSLSDRVPVSKASPNDASG